MFASLINLSTLESHLWESANILRGPVDAADFKTYIFPALFFKRISDVYDEEVAAALEESEGARASGQHSVWCSLRSTIRCQNQEWAHGARRALEVHAAPAVSSLGPADVIIL